MGLENTPHAIGFLREFFAMPEATAGTYVKPAAIGGIGPGMAILEATFDHKVGRRMRLDTSQTRSHTKRVSARQENTWNMKKHTIASGTAGTKPDDHDMLEAVFGLETVVGGTSVTYAPIDAQGSLQTLTLGHHWDSVRSEGGDFCVVNSLKYSVVDGDSPTYEYEGFFADFISTGYGTADGAGASSASLTVQTGEGKLYKTNSRISIGSTDDAIVNSVSGDVLTLDTTYNWSDNDVVKPYEPALVDAGDLLSETIGSITVAGNAVVCKGFEVIINNQIKPINNRVFTSTLTDGIEMRRLVSGTFTLEGRRDMFQYLASRDDLVEVAIVVTVGNVAGNRIVTTMNQVEMEFSPLAVPQEEEGEMVIPFVCLGSSGADEISQAYT